MDTHPQVTTITSPSIRSAPHVHSHRNPSMKTHQDNASLQTPPAAWIGLDWGDKEHAFVIEDATGKSEAGTLPHSAEKLHSWLLALRERYGGRQVALAIEASRGAVIHA